MIQKQAARLNQLIALLALYDIKHMSKCKCKRPVIGGYVD